VEAGDRAPEFRLPAGPAEIDLRALRGGKVVLFFYPKDDTETCTAEAIAFNGLGGQFAAAGAAHRDFARQPQKPRQVPA
jgi:peroxiredoxin Q/BCP